MRVADKWIREAAAVVLGSWMAVLICIALIALLGGCCRETIKPSINDTANYFPQPIPSEPVRPVAKNRRRNPPPDWAANRLHRDAVPLPELIPEPEWHKVPLRGSGQTVHRDHEPTPVPTPAKDNPWQ